jgi:ribosomal protein S12 methylthiotransferase accessory factor
MMQTFVHAEAPADLVTRLSGLIHPEHGVIKEIVTCTADGKPAGLPICAAAILRHGTDDLCGYGKGLSLKEAILGAVGEALEIHASSSYDPGKFLRASTDELQEEVLDPQKLCLYADPYYDLPDFPYCRFHRSQPIDWTSANWLHTGEPVWVPALPVFSKLLVPAHERFCQVTSNGLAAGADLNDAAMRATLELIERDAFMLSWFCRLPGQELDVDGSLEPGAETVLEMIRQRGARISFYLLDAGIHVPTVLCIARGNGKTWPGATLGLGCHLNLLTAVRKAVMELGQTGPEFCRTMISGDEFVPRSPGDVQTFRQHGLFYLPEKRNRAFDFLHDGNKPPIRVRDLSQPEEMSLAVLVEMLRTAGVRVAIVDLTAAALCAAGFSVVRALGENMQQIHCGFGRERLNNPRLQNLLQGPVNFAIPPVC